MEIIQIIKLFKRNLLLLIAIPIIFAGVTYYFTRNQEKVYQSEAVIYTGIATGYSIESASQRRSDYFTTNAQFDNMINLLKSRQTLIETSLQLLTQDLSLEHYNAQYISQSNFNRLQASIPKRIKDLVVKNNKSGVEREKEAQINNLEKEIKDLEREINKKKNRATRDRTSLGKTVEQTDNSEIGIEKESMSIDLDDGTDFFTSHIVQQGESLPLLASRYGVSQGQIMSLNNLSTSTITPGQSLIIKKTPVNGNRYHIVKPNETLYSIAKKYGVNISKLRELNGVDNRPLSNGQKLLISRSQSATNSGYSADFSIKQISNDIPESQPGITSNYVSSPDYGSVETNNLSVFSK
ncbi:MAG: LysM peptidoglycan-binding domain-containing protein, partial [Bacteroidota bacterium]